MEAASIRFLFLDVYIAQNTNQMLEIRYEIRRPKLYLALHFCFPLLVQFGYSIERIITVGQKKCLRFAYRKHKGMNSEVCTYLAYGVSELCLQKKEYYFTSI